MFLRRYGWIVVFGCFLPTVRAADLVVLTPDNWSEYAVAGKEADAIYGDYVLRNELVTAVIAAPVKGRHANMTVHNVGGSVIDFTQRGKQNDQLSVWWAYPAFSFPANPAKVEITADGKKEASSAKLSLTTRKSITWSCEAELPPPLAAAPAGGNPPPKFQCAAKYTLADGQPYLLIETTYKNVSGEKQTLQPQDGFRADKSFEFGTVADLKLFFASDDWFRQCYGLVSDYSYSREPRNGSPLKYALADGKPIEIDAGKSYTISRKLLCGANLQEVRAIARKLVEPDAKLTKVALVVKDSAGPVNNARIELRSPEGAPLSSVRTGSDGRVEFEIQPGKHQLVATALGRPKLTREATWELPSAGMVLEFASPPGYVAAKITDEQGGPIACKVEFHNPLVKRMPKPLRNVPLPKVNENDPVEPDFGPDGAAPNCKNLVYTASGEFRQELPPGKYQVIVSHGPEYDAVFSELTVSAGKDEKLSAKLVRSVDTRGWVSADFHSHSTPSGDNTSETLGRVLNLLCEHIEFAPCTEHNRVTTYDKYLADLSATARMKSCPGIELTGVPLPLNHQNAFPLKESLHTQDGGGPIPDLDPVVQIGRLALWDHGSEKLVQQNHPNLVQMLGDKDNDGSADGGFARMFGLMHVVEVHDQNGIIKLPIHEAGKRATEQNMFHWVQLLNLGYRVPGVVNTDAHYNFHGSGWLRNWVASSSDDPQKIDVMEMVRHSKAGRIVMSNGPFLSVEARPGAATDPAKGTVKGPGDDLAAKDGKCSLHIRVQCPNWLDINRVQVFLNGKADERYNFTRRTAPDKFGNGAVKFDQTISLELPSDAHLIVAALGENLQLGPVLGPDHEDKQPIAIANPVFVIVGEKNYFQANKDALGGKLLVTPDNIPADRPKAK